MYFADFICSRGLELKVYQTTKSRVCVSHSKGLVAVLLSWNWLRSHRWLVTPFFSSQKSVPFLFPRFLRKKMKKSDREKRSIYYLVFRLKEGKFTPFSTGHDKQFSFQNLVFNKWDETSNKYLLNRLVWDTPNKKCLPATVFFLSQIELTVKTSIPVISKTSLVTPNFLPLIWSGRYLTTVKVI